jgi:hypothetical protein
LAGDAGFRSLLSRSLARAGEEVHWLRAVHVKSDGALDGWGELHTQLSPEAWFEGRVALLAHLLGLLVTFIGENLTLRLVHEAWPNAPLKKSGLN